MAIERHVVELSARDTLTPVLKKVGTEAENAGRKAEDSSKRASRSMQDWNRAASALGLAIGAGLGAAIKISNEAEVVQARLRTSIENTGHAYEEYADQIDKASQAALKLGFDDEDAADSIAKITTVTNDATKGINDLALAQDIARGRGISLAQATDLVVAAESGRFRSLQMIGIRLDENATKEDYLAALQQKYAGQAQAYAETNQATWDRFGNTIENTLESIGGHLADFQGPLVALSAGATALGPLGQAFEALDGKAKIASLSSKILASSWAGPAGLAVGAGIAGVAIYELMTRESDHERQVKALDKATQDYVHTLADLTTELVRAGAFDLTESTQAFLDTWAKNGIIAQDRIDNVSEAIDYLNMNQQTLVDGIPAGEFMAGGQFADDYTDSLLKLSGAYEDGFVTAQELAAVQTTLASGFELTRDQATQLQNAYTGLLDDIANPELYGTEIAKQAQQIIQDVVNGVIDVQTGIQRLNALPLDPKFNKALQEQKRSTDDLNMSTADLYNTLYGGVNALANNQDLITANADAMKDWIESQTDAGHAITDNIDDLVKQQHALDGAADGFDAVDHSARGASQGMDTFAGGARGATDASKALDDQLANLDQTLGSLTPGDVLDSTFGAIVGNTDQLVGSIDKVKQWSDAVMAPLGTDFQENGALSKLVELQNKGLLDAEDYTEALKSQEQIYGDLARAQDASAAIQIKQSNYMADATDAVADYLEEIAKMPEADQATALAWADADISGRAQDIADMASEWDNMSEAQQQAFENTTLSAAKMDPMLANLLFKMGILKGDINDPSSWTISTDSSDAESDIDRLNETMADFIRLFDPTYIANTDINDMGAVARAGIKLELFNLDNTTATPNVDADTSLFWQAVNGIDGHYVGTAYVNVQGVTSGVGANVGFQALGGVSPWPDTAALGRLSAGNLTMVGEHGPELVSLPGGAHVLPNHATRYDQRVRGGGAGIVIQNMTVVANDPQTFMRQMRTYQQSMSR